MNRIRRLLCAAAVASAAWSIAVGDALAQSALPPPPATAPRSAPPPPKLEPLPEAAGDSELEPQVTITRREGETVEEARVNGKLMWVKVTPAHGRPYFLIPDAGGHTYIRRDSHDSGLKVPLWVLFSF